MISNHGHTVDGCRVDNFAVWFLKLPHCEANEQQIYNVNILEGSSSVLELLEIIGNSGWMVFLSGERSRIVP